MRKILVAFVLSALLFVLLSSAVPAQDEQPVVECFQPPEYLFVRETLICRMVDTKSGITCYWNPFPSDETKNQMRCFPISKG